MSKESDKRITLNAGDLVLNKDGRWIVRGGEITHEGIIANLWSSFVRLDSGEYVIRQGRFDVPVIIEDAPYVVESTRDDDDESIVLVLSDGSNEKLGPNDFWISDEHVPYTLVKDKKDLARFSRTAYSQLYEKLTEKDDRYYIKLGENFYEIKKGRPKL